MLLREIQSQSMRWLGIGDGSPLMPRWARGAIITGGSQSVYSASFGASRPSAFSLVGWFKAPAAPNATSSYLWSVGNSATYPNDLGDLFQCWGNTLAGNRNRAVIHRAGTTYSTYGTAGSGVLNQWTHLAAAYDGSGLLVYENGSLLGSRLAATITAGAPADWVVTFGGTNGGVAELPANFKLAACGYWPVALNAADVGSLARGAAPYKVRPNDLQFCVMGFRNANAMKGSTAGATGITFDDDNPRLYL